MSGRASDLVPQAAGRLWCVTCQEPMRLVGRGLIAELNKGVHLSTGLETGPDGHPGKLTDENPVLRAQADEIEAEFPWVRVSVRFGIFRAVLRRELVPPGGVAVPYKGHNAGELREQLRAAAAGPHRQQETAAAGDVP